MLGRLQYNLLDLIVCSWGLYECRQIIVINFKTYKDNQFDFSRKFSIVIKMICDKNVSFLNEVFELQRWRIFINIILAETKIAENREFRF